MPVPPIQIPMQLRRSTEGLYPLETLSIMVIVLPKLCSDTIFASSLFHLFLYFGVFYIEILAQHCCCAWVVSSRGWCSLSWST
jgi:hypothetical protein